ncbi:McrB family protein [Effusibacillus pohliae]|uniref:McrB family protein n=1 Tax=Effusibacillus pohliae TaxID=232270 RepID=UPI000378DDE3|nr:AAA family ATPase [Effusibacillus pohliae]
MQKIINIILSRDLSNWNERNQEAFDELFGANGGRYPESARKSVKLRAPEFRGDSGVPFAAYIHPSNPDSGAYGGLSFVIFPVENEPCLVGLVVGTKGLSPDEAVLSRPGHARKVQSICQWLNHQYGKGKLIAWAKHDPIRTDLNVPDSVKREFSLYESVFKRYGHEIYGLFVPNADQEATRSAVTAFLDLMFEERGHMPLKGAQAESETIRSQYLSHMMPTVSEEDVIDLLNARRFVILQGPPGTGKTRMARILLNEHFHGNGFSVQFHANTTYENFIGGLAPMRTEGGFGFQFAPKKGHLMVAIERALQNPDKPYLLHIDEINRADLSKVLGEAIFLFEANAVEEQRDLMLPYDFGEPFYDRLWLPSNLYILGTMNSADRSIAILDIAVQRRFAFVNVWPQLSVIHEHSNETMQQLFMELQSIFVEYANDEAMSLMPGHSYFLNPHGTDDLSLLRATLLPLLEEYLVQGYVTGFSEQIRAYMQKLRV